MLAAVQTTRTMPRTTSSADSNFGSTGNKNGRSSNARKKSGSRRQIAFQPPRTALVSIVNKSDSAVQSRQNAQRERDEQFRNLRTPEQSAPVSGGGEPLPLPVRQALERSFNVDLNSVRVHTGAQAQNAAGNLSARAFTVGNNIFLGAGERATDLGLMAHETAHVVQQRGAPALQRFASGQGDSNEREAQRSSEAVMRGESVTIQGRTSGLTIQRLGLGDILNGLANLAANLPGFTLLTVIIGRNPINQRVVERNFTNLLRGFMGLIPVGGEIMFQVINRYGVVERIGRWVSEQLNALGFSYQYIRGRFSAFTGSLGFRDFFSPRDVWRRVENIFTELINRIRSFISRLIPQAITWLKETFMQPLSNFCREIRGYTLVTVLLGRDPFTGVAVPRSALNVVRAFAEFIPGGTEKVNQLVESRGLENAYNWFIQETQTRNLTWARISGTFSQAWNSLRLEDVLHPIDTLTRMVGMFRPLMTDLVGFAGAALMKLLELIFEAVMGSGGRRILAILKRARETFFTIIRNPVGFLRNLLGAVGQGVRQFMRNILAHLRAGVIAWLTGPVARAGVQMPERWDLRGIIWFVMQILGLTWTRVRQKLVRLMGERAVGMLETGFQLIQDIRRLGLVGALRERVTEFFGQLREAALGSIRSFIQQRLVAAGIQQLLSLLSPVGAIIQAIIKTYTTIQFFIQRINQILDLVESVVNSIAAIASGAIGQAANFVERTMARTIPVILDFLARFIGLGDVGAQVQRTIQGLQARVDQMLDRAVDWIKNMAQRIGGAIVRGARSVVERVVDWWRARKNFRTRTNESHSLYFTGSAPGAQLVLASGRPIPILQRIANAKQAQTASLTGTEKRNKETEYDNAHTAVRGKLAEIQTLTSANTGGTRRQSVGREIALKLDEIEAIISGLAFDDVTLPVTRVTFQANAGRASQVIAEPLTKNEGNTHGSETSTSVNPSGFDFVQHVHRMIAPSLLWDKIHLLHSDLHGPGNQTGNLAVADKRVNSDMRDRVEADAIGKVHNQQPKTIERYKTVVDYPASNPISFRGRSSDDKYFASRVRVWVKEDGRESQKYDSRALPKMSDSVGALAGNARSLMQAAQRVLESKFDAINNRIISEHANNTLSDLGWDSRTKPIRIVQNLNLDRELFVPYTQLSRGEFQTVLREYFNEAIRHMQDNDNLNSSALSQRRAAALARVAALIT